MRGNDAACIASVLSEEGGFVNNPRDPGGPTKYGITLATLAHELRRPVTSGDVEAITPELATCIYRARYWNAINGDVLPAGLDMLALDCAVNNGVGRARQWLSEVQGKDSQAALIYLDRRRRTFWRSLACFCTFGRGWFARENRVFAKAEAMAHK